MAVAAAEKPVDVIAVRLGAGMRRAREIAGVTQAELARRLSVPPGYVNRWESGGRRLDIETVEQAEQLMSLVPGTVLRCADFVDDGELIDLGSLSSEAQRAIRAILREFEAVNGDSTNGP